MRQEKIKALHIISDQIISERWEEVRGPNQKGAQRDQGFEAQDS